jgi:hypothetical protein
MNPMVMQAFGPEVLKNVVVRTLRKFDVDFPDAIFKDAEEWIPPAERAKLHQEELGRVESSTAININGQPGPPAGRLQPNQSGGGMVEGVPPNGISGNAGGSIADSLQSLLQGGGF